MKPLVTLGLLLACTSLSGQNLTWNWARKFETSLKLDCSIKAVNDRNNSYVTIYYEDTLVIGDTVFVHPLDPNYVYRALATLDQFGNVMNAMDFYSPTGSQSGPVAVAPLSGGDFVTGGSFYQSYLASDTTLYSDAGTDVFIARFDARGKHRWLKTIHGDNQDDLCSILPAGDGSLFIAGLHYANPAQTVWLNFFGTDSVQHTGMLMYLLKIDTLGHILWRKTFAAPDSCESIQVRNVLTGKDGNVYFHWESLCPLVSGKDAPNHPAEYGYLNLIYVFDGEGNPVAQQSENWPMNIGCMHVDAAGNLIFAGGIYNTVHFPNDSIVIPTGHFPFVLGKMDAQHNLLWYHLYEPQIYNMYHWVEFTAMEDTLYVTLTFEGRITVGSTTYQTLLGRRTLLMEMTTAGELKQVNMLDGNSFNYSYHVVPDHCSNLLVSGVFGGYAYFPPDTLHTLKSAAAFVARVKKWAHTMNVGPDTTINYSDAVTLSAGEGYDSYQWSTGGTSSTEQIHGATLGPGVHPVRVLAYLNGCASTDTVVITVKNNMGEEEPGNRQAGFRISPNPAAGFATLQFTPGSTEQPVGVTLYDLSGRPVAEYRIAQPADAIRLDLSGLHRGMYLVAVGWDHGSATWGKLVTE
ncbi:MAG TPA: T9SS type A sorting domain-containing protein [Bacteroidales bacterium]|nr:T9SS type A sorting domain-containing protein [Bacteroidales bacterium]